MYIVKSLLYQLLNLRVGDMGTYHALVHAYKKSRCSTDTRQYEDHLWKALGTALKNPPDGANDLVIIVDGFDELTDEAKASQAFLEKLVDVVSQCKHVKLIALSQPLSIPSRNRGSQLVITREHTHEDIDAAVHRSLEHCHHLHGKPKSEQESILGRITRAANGCFLWIFLTCELLMREKSQAGFLKAVADFETSPPSIQEITLKLLSVLELSTSEKHILSWLVTAERPLTLLEISSLFSVDHQREAFLNESVDERGQKIQSMVDLLKPILSIHGNIVRLRHYTIRSSLQAIIDQGKLPMPIKERQMDLVLRTLTYAKLILRGERAPTFEISDWGFADELFRHHHFLEYVVRYWIYHLSQSSIVPKESGDFNVTIEMQKVFPNTTELPILERLCWEAQIPAPQVVDLHVLAGRLRRQVLKGNNTTILQSYMTCAAYYEILSKPTESSEYYYLSVTISRTVFNEFHPLTVECANHFLQTTETMTSTSRTEIMTRREYTLKILIGAYEHQYGATSAIVIQTKRSLINLYKYIHEEQHAADFESTIHKATSEIYLRHPDEYRGVSGSFGVVIGRTRSGNIIEPYNHSIIKITDGEETVEFISVDQIADVLRQAYTYLSSGDVPKAEQTYVELWQYVSEWCRTTFLKEWHERKIDITLAYSQFLQSQKRESEASAILTCLWQEYEHHELSLFESIISRLTEVAKAMKTVGSYATALLILNHANSYYKNVRKEESHTFTEIQQEVGDSLSSS